VEQNKTRIEPSVRASSVCILTVISIRIGAMWEEQMEKDQLHFVTGGGKQDTEIRDCERSGTRRCARSIEYIPTDAYPSMLTEGFQAVEKVFT